MSFRYETQMLEKVISNQFVNKVFVSTNFSKTIYFRCELEHLFGIPDIVFTQFNENNVICTCAVELKLSNWNRALIQAFRYRSFADYSYVVLDNSRINSARTNLLEFKKKNVGLFGVDEKGRVYDYYSPELRPPYSPQMVKKIYEMAKKGEGFQKLILN